MNKVQIIAHGANSLEKIQKAFKNGADLVEVDVSKQVFTSRFVSQHQGVLGKFGIGQNLTSILKEIPKDKVIFDIKHPQFTPSFAEKFDALLKKFKFNNALISSDNFEVLEKLSQEGNYNIYFSVEHEKNVEKLINFKNQNKKKNFGAIIDNRFLNKVDISQLKTNSLEVFVGPINKIELFKKAQKLGVDGIITDNLKQLLF